MADYARGERLRELRESKHASQESVAFEVGVSTKTLRNWEHGGKIRWDNAKRLAAYYGANPETLVSRETTEPSGTDDSTVTQLDRIENMLSELLDRLVADGVLQAVARDVEQAPPRAPSRRPRRAA